MEHLPPSITVDAYPVFVEAEMVDCFPDHKSAKEFAHQHGGSIERKVLTLTSDGKVYLDMDKPCDLDKYRHRFEQVLRQKAVATLVGNK